MRIRWRGFELPTRVEKEEESVTPNYSKFMAEPFERGFATTIGNSLRRVLLSSVQGAAVRAIRIEGANNEYCALDGVLEDVTHLILNIKRLRMRLHSDEGVVLRLEKSEAGPVTAADITPHQDVEIINPELVICNLTTDTRFAMELDVGSGRGFVPAEQQDIDEAPVGTIATDSIFSPVVRVSFDVEATRLGKRSDFERLVLQVWTDGSISPELSLVEATNILRKHLNPFVKYFEIGRELEGGGQGEMVIEGDVERSVLLSKPISYLRLSVRSENALRATNIKTIADLVQMDESEVASISNLGKISTKELKKKLADRGLSFGMRLAPSGSAAS
ncbi:MAG: DNA-directed RNA polymerase subunit alpha [Planctomycetota bacterium]